jgi:energy-coupling factor transporter transmembrane protein EcfT
MALRLVATLAGLLTIGSCLSPLAVIRGLSRMLGRDLALACAIGVNLLPAMVEMLRRTTLAMRLRGGFRRRRLANIKRLVVAVGLQTVRLTEDVAEALLLSGVLDGHETVTRRTVEPAPDSSRRPE